MISVQAVFLGILDQIVLKYVDQHAQAALTMTPVLNVNLESTVHHVKTHADLNARHVRDMIIVQNVAEVDMVMLVIRYAKLPVPVVQITIHVRNAYQENMDIGVIMTAKKDVKTIFVQEAVNVFFLAARLVITMILCTTVVKNVTITV